MTTLPLDKSRCSGRISFAADHAQWCLERRTCQRYLAFSQWDREAGMPDYKGVPATMAVLECRHKIEMETKDAES